MNVLLGVAGVYFALVVLVFLFQRRLQYFPWTGDPEIPAGPRYEAVQDVTLTAADGVKLKAWYWPGKKPVTLFIFHGNAGHRGHRLEWVDDLRAMGPGIFLLDYRGFGGSGGSPSEEGLYLDADAAELWLNEHTHGDVVYFGESIGCSVAVDLATRRPPAAMILQSPAISLVDVAKKAYPFLPVSLLMKDRYDSRGKIEVIACPLLFIHGTADRIVPIELGRRLYDAATGEKEWYEVERGDHNALPWIGGHDYLERIRTFLAARVRGMAKD